MRREHEGSKQSFGNKLLFYEVAMKGDDSIPFEGWQFFYK